MQFEFATSNRIVFGPGTVLQGPGFAESLGQRAILITDSRERSAPLLKGFSAQGVHVEVFLIENEPDIISVTLATRIATESDCHFVVGFGGGSTLDTGKTVAALMTNSGDLLDFLEVIGGGLSLRNPSAPFIAIPTTAGTGSEVTRNAVISVPERRIKVSLRSPYLLPRISVVDPELSYSMPPSVTAFTGMDALTQLIEPFTCNSPTPLTDAICRDGIPRAARSLLKAFNSPFDTAGRQDMAIASLFGGMALANARLGAVHGMANLVGGMSHAPHGAICARLLPLVMETNLTALQARQPNSPVIPRYAEVARLVTGDANASAETGVIWVKALCQTLGIRPLREFDLNPKDFPTLVELSRKASSMKGNPLILTDMELMTILENAV
jgi:alcohol dehydrogenase class IV